MTGVLGRKGGDAQRFRTGDKHQVKRKFASDTFTGQGRPRIAENTRS